MQSIKKIKQGKNPYAKHSPLLRTGEYGPLFLIYNNKIMLFRKKKKDSFKGTENLCLKIKKIDPKKVLLAFDLGDLCPRKSVSIKMGDKFEKYSRDCPISC